MDIEKQEEQPTATNSKPTSPEMLSKLTFTSLFRHINNWNIQI